MPGDKISPGATDWHPAGTIQPTSKQANFFAGAIKPGRVVRVSGRPLPLGEPVAELVAVKFDQEFGTTVPGKREVRRSDWLNFNVADAHVLHPVDWTVRKVPQALVNTDHLVVDIMGGEKLGKTPNKQLFELNMPGEVLLIDPLAGKARV